MKTIRLEIRNHDRVEAIATNTPGIGWALEARNYNTNTTATAHMREALEPQVYDRLRNLAHSVERCGEDRPH